MSLTLIHRDVSCHDPPSRYNRGMEIAHKPHLHQDWIDPHAFGIVKALQRAGFESYLVGGCVRDLLLGLHPKDYDIATLAQPNQIKKLIYNSYIIGRRFLLVLAKRDSQQFEIATFRQETKPEPLIEGEEPGEARLGDNTFGTPEEDARRRDFTINALFYDPVNEDLIDFVEAMRDIKTRTLRMIGDPDVRLVEDPIRLLRALRFAHKLELFLDEDLRESMKRNASSIAASVLPRRREEILKFLRLHEPFLAFAEAFDLGILEYLSPYLHSIFLNDTYRENFQFYLSQFKELTVENFESQHLLSWIVLSCAYATCAGEWPTSAQMRADDMQNFIRNEIGMFKLEQSFLGHTLQLSGMLQKTPLLKKRGPRRLMSIFRNESFAFCLKLVEVNFEISAQDISFWKNSAREVASDIKPREPGRRPARPRRRRKKVSGALTETLKAES